MDTVLRVLVYVVVGLILLLANLWFVRSLIQEIGGVPPSAIGAFSVSGKDDPGNKHGIALANMLAATVRRIGDEMKAASQAMEGARKATQADVVRPQVDVPDVPLTVPIEIFQPLDIKLSLGGVEVGGVLSWLQGAMMKERVLSFSVQYADNQTLVTGQVPGGNPFFLEVDGAKQRDIVEAVAYTLVQDQLSRTIPELAALELKDVREVLGSLQEVAKLERHAALGRVADDRIVSLLSRLDTLSAKMPGWMELRQVTAEIAERAKQDAKALSYYEKLRADAKRQSTYEKMLDEKIRLLSARLQQAQAARTVAAKVVAQAAQAAAEAAVSRTAGPSLVPASSKDPLLAAPTTTGLLELVGVKSLEMPKTVRVAVLGGVPAKGQVPEQRMTVIGHETAARTDDYMEEYLGTISQWVRLIAPETHFVFRPMRGTGGAFSSSEIVAALNDLIAAHPDVLLVTLGPLDGKAFTVAFEDAAARGILIVLAAGNDPRLAFPFASSPLADRMLVVSAVTMTGEPAVFSPSHEKAVWAPGVDLPVMIGSKGQESRSGTTYAAAVAAGLAARVLASRKIDKPEDAVRVLRTTARPAPGRTAPVILNLGAALGGV